jgi:hypothetical protein
MHFECLQNHVDTPITEAIFTGIVGEPPGLAAVGRAFDTASKLDGTNVEATIGRAKTELLMNEDIRAYGILEESKKYIQTPNQEISDLYSEIGRRLQIAKDNQYRTAYRRAESFKTSD